jgi:predicted RNase H-like nuclease
MNKTELKNLAIKKLNSKEIKEIKKKLCKTFTDRKERKECITAFDKNFIKSFIRSYQNKN